MRRVILVLLGLLSLSACGGASHSSGTSTTHTTAANPEQTRLLSELRSALEDPASPLANVRDLDECIVQQAKRLPMAALRKLASGDASTSDTDPLTARCVAQGKGLNYVRGVVANVVAGKLKPPIPASFRNCVVAGVGALPPAQLAAALNQEGVGRHDYSQRLGRRLALACVKKPAIFRQWQKVWVAQIRSSLNGRHLPAAFVQCVLGKAGQVGATQLINLVQAGAAAETAYGEKLGRACRSSLSG